MKLDYPSSTRLEEHCSIFILNLQHRVAYSHFKFTSISPSANPLFTDWTSRLEDAGWQLHEYLKTSSGERQRLFQPDGILTFYAHESLFGQSRFHEGENPVDFLKKQLNPNASAYPRAETLLLSLRETPDNRLNKPLQTAEYKMASNADGLLFTFRIEWADLWIFPDSIATLAFKVVLQTVQDPPRAPCVGDLSAFTRWFRHTLYQGVRVWPESVPDESLRWWQDIVFGQWLKNGEILQPPQSAGWNTPFAAKTAEQVSWPVLIHHNRYTKILAAARIPDLPYDNIEQARQLEQEWQGSEQPEYKPYGSLHAALVTELATASDEGAALGAQAYINSEGRKWRVHPDYLKKLYKRHKLEVWAYWNGIVLRDACAFLAWDATMPVVKQAESRYYPLYVHICHLHFRLEDFAGGVIDYRLENTQQANLLLEAFHAFRNQYWFKELTVDFFGMEVYRCMKQGLDIDAQYARVSDEVKQISTYLNAKQNKGWQYVMGLAVVFFYPLQMIWKELLRLWPDFYLEFWHEHPFALILLGLLGLWLGIRVLRMRQRFTGLRQRLAAWGYRRKFLS
ncbi:MAG: hypothetical protein GY862_31190 [Gammaproteobacteria bacterium]|nr:hypothetical protein [Gammaproteobacteria bacterium]